MLGTDPLGQNDDVIFGGVQSNEGKLVSRMKR